MATIDQQFVEYIVKTLVNNPDDVKVDRKIDEKGVLLSLTVDPSDVGRVIGKRGVTAQAIRVLLRALGTKQDARYNLKIVNTDDVAAKDDAKVEKPVEKTPAKEAEPVPAEEESEEEVVTEEEAEEDEPEAEDESSDLAKKTRAELADLDDLDL